MSDPNDIIDEWLVLRCQGGDADAMAELVRRWQPRLKGFAFRLMHDQSITDDVLQATWMDVVRRIRSLRDPRSFRAWLFRIAANKCADHIRRATRERRMLATASCDQAEAFPDPSTPSTGDANDDLEQLQAAVGRLDDDSQRLLRWHYLDSLSVDQIAQRISKPPGTVKSRLFHIRKKLKAALIGEA
ncbi:MAG: RNA polymerase sigma factor [Planctomycetota bacterium]